MQTETIDSIVCGLANVENLAIAKSKFKKIVLTWNDARDGYDAVYIHYKRGKVARVCVNSLDLFNVYFMVSLGTCYNTDKTKQPKQNVNIQDLHKVLL